MIELGYVSSVEAGEIQWEECRNSSDEDCQSFQDSLASQFARKLKKNLVGNRNSYGQLYLRWKIGVTTSDVIFDAYINNEDITDIVRIRLMDKQAWCVDDPCYGDTTKFFDNLNQYILARGLDPEVKV